MFVIKSNTSDRELVLQNLDGDYFEVELKGSKINVSTSIYAYMNAQSIYNLFEELASLEKPWLDEKKWESIEGDFSLRFTCDVLGHVLLQINIWMQQGHPEAAYISVGLSTEFGMLPSIGRDAQRFFSQTAN